MMHETPARSFSAIEIFAHLVLGIAITLAVFLGGFALGMKFLPAQQTAQPTAVVEETGEPTTEEAIEPVDENTLVIDWLPVINQSEIESRTDLSAAMYQDNFGEGVDEMGIENQPRTFILGTVDGGAYDGYALNLMLVDFPAMGLDTAHLYFLVSPVEEKPLLLDQYSSFVGSAFSNPTTPDPLLTNYPSLQVLVQTNLDLVIPELEAPEEPITDAQGNTYTYKGAWYRADVANFTPTNVPHQVTLMTGETLSEYVFTEGETGNIFFASGSYGFYDVREDGRLIWFDMNVPFWSDPYDIGEKEQADPPSITWKDGTVNDALYIKGGMGGCGMTTYANVREASEIGEMVEAGTYQINGKTGTVYEVVSYDTEHYQFAFESWKMFEDTRTWEQFLSGHPYFYWQDSLGRWIEFTNVNDLPAAECGKPVIYLYPEEPTDITVRIQANLSVSEPAYDNGWHVIAYPDGTLITEDGTAYPYLFWEGLGSRYASPKDYWVIKQGEVETFLLETLTKLGLNKKETADFMEFWLPRMQEAPYYKIGFHGTRAMNLIAPLSFSVQPDMTLRILMDYEPLETALPAHPPTLPPTPVRRGFSVIEWGGVLR
jgi:hypothetical protein